MNNNDNSHGTNGEGGGYWRGHIYFDAFRWNGFKACAQRACEKPINKPACTHIIMLFHSPQDAELFPGVAQQRGGFGTVRGEESN